MSDCACVFLIYVIFYFGVSLFRLHCFTYLSSAVFSTTVSCLWICSSRHLLDYLFVFFLRIRFPVCHHLSIYQLTRLIYWFIVPTFEVRSRIPGPTTAMPWFKVKQLSKIADRSWASLMLGTSSMIFSSVPSQKTWHASRKNGITHRLAKASDDP